MRRKPVPRAHANGLFHANALLRSPNIPLGIRARHFGGNAIIGANGSEG
jgi:hypothetical protein